MKGDMRATVFALFTFEAAHRLENVPDGHKCKRLHGHTYEVRIEITGEIQERLGWVIDYAEIALAWEQVFKKVDHQNLNDVLPEMGGNTTSENLAHYIRAATAHSLGVNDEARRDLWTRTAVEVWETATCGARAG